MAMTMERKLQYLRTLAAESTYLKLGTRYHLIISDHEAPVLFKNAVKKTGFWGSVTGGTTGWAYIACKSMVVRLDERYEDKNVGGGSFGKSLAGELLFGTAGAIVGGAGRGVQKSRLTKLNINIYDKDNMTMIPFLQLRLLAAPCDSRSITYQQKIDWVQKFIQLTTKYGASFQGEERKPDIAAD
ncbi:hypothetical protein [Liquorilactobacillus mali]|nr:hypothetical protein [Liquorilactobacillus mali]